MKIIKRDGRLKSYSSMRIHTAIRNAYIEVYGNDEEFKLDYAFIEPKMELYIKKLESQGMANISIEEIQDIVVKMLKEFNPDVSQAYQEYREDRTFEREKRGDLDKEIDNIICANSEENTSNGNVDGSKIQSLRALIVNYVCRQYSRRKYIPKKYRKKHMKSIYLHDEQYFGLPFWNCCNADWQDMFEHGFDLGTTKIDTPKSLTTAVNILTQVSSHISSNTYGGTTFPKLVSGLTPYAKASLQKHRELADIYVKDELKEEYVWNQLKKECEDATQSLEYEIQTLMTSRSETPFLTLGIDIIDETQDEETIKIQKMITMAMLNQRLKGLTGGVTPVFPKLTYQLKRGNNLDKNDPFYELFKTSVEVSANRQYPDYVMTDRLIEVTGSYKDPMGK